MNESQIRNMTPDELLSAFECGQLTDDNVKLAFGQVVEALGEEASKSERMFRALDAINDGADDPYAQSFFALQDLGLTNNQKPFEDKRINAFIALRQIAALSEEYNT